MLPPNPLVPFHAHFGCSILASGTLQEAFGAKFEVHWQSRFPGSKRVCFAWRRPNAHNLSELQFLVRRSRLPTSSLGFPRLYKTNAAVKSGVSADIFFAWLRKGYPTVPAQAQSGRHSGGRRDRPVAHEPRGGRTTSGGLPGPSPRRGGVGPPCGTSG